jgi:hypothetical protein
VLITCSYHNKESSTFGKAHIWIIKDQLGGMNSGTRGRRTRLVVEAIGDATVLLVGRENLALYSSTWHLLKERWKMMQSGPKSRMTCGLMCG